MPHLGAPLATLGKTRVARQLGVPELYYPNLHTIAYGRRGLNTHTIWTTTHTK